MQLVSFDFYTGVGDHVANHEPSWCAWRGSSSWYLGLILSFFIFKRSWALVLSQIFYMNHLFPRQPLISHVNTWYWFLQYISEWYFIYFRIVLYIFQNGTLYISGWYLTFGFWAMLHEPVHFVVFLSFFAFQDVENILS